MAMDKVVAALVQAPALSGLSPQQLAHIARHARKLKFLRGDIITRAGQHGDGAFLIVSGPVERLVGRGVGAAGEPVAPGSLIGEMAMLIEHEYGSTVVARDWVYCVKITRAAMHAQMLEDPAVAEHFQQRVTARLHEMAEGLRRIDQALAAVGQAGSRRAPMAMAAGSAAALGGAQPGV